ncbi:type 2 DNA topoisomerase 6 subunit B-like isoform X1 [Amborella trichopoda]|uniref:type 2 DNA topoisomerase 6 subunit B-like isoform X1 n=1 Tax=Amborella trichopoda TaxID=13333 RepID=UPI0009C0412D|nr:type 2 DNA topoisomerase 6 subunit B-like isoform X1 [Amborella trichopoda]|eukprot:XP_020520713.1 type 2 DNA topoisomerase 6 subunit B-like isoform X1 [Amborella trichopoda]
MEEASATQKLCYYLIGLAIQRCRMCETLCRVSIVLKRSSVAVSHLSIISISDTGVGSSLCEFQDLEHHFSDNTEQSCEVGTEKCDKVLSITTTDAGTQDKEIHHYQLRLADVLPRSRLIQLASTPKYGGEFSGTEVSLSTQESISDCVTFISHLCEKIFLLKMPNIAFELVVEDMNTLNVTRENLIVENGGILLPFSITNLERLTSSMVEFSVRHGNVLDENCWSCLSNREQFMLGAGAASMDNVKGTKQVVEAVFVVTRVSESSNIPCLRTGNNFTKVLYFQDFMPCSFPPSTLNALTCINWQKYGLAVKATSLDGNGDAVLEWEDLPYFMHIYLVVHNYQKEVFIPQTRVNNQGSLVKKAIQLALDDLKAKYTGFFLSKHALRIRNYVPDLSKAIAGLILSSNDEDFIGDCASLLGMIPSEAGEQGRVESCISEKILGVIEINDLKSKKGEGARQDLFEQEKNLEGEERDEDEDEDADDEGGMLDWGGEF